MSEVNESVWKGFLTSFNAAKTKGDYAALKNEVKASKVLTFRQRDALFARCDHQVDILEGRAKERKKTEMNGFSKKRAEQKGVSSN